MKSLEDRIVLLEKSRANHRLLSVAALASSGLFVLLSAMRSEPVVISVDEVRTERLVIGASGQAPRGVFEVRHDFAAFEMFGADKQERVSIGAKSGTPAATALTLFDETGRSRFEAVSQPGHLELLMNTWDPTSYRVEEELKEKPNRSLLMLTSSPRLTGLQAGAGTSLNTAFGMKAEKDERYGLMYLQHSRPISFEDSGKHDLWGGGSYFSVMPGGKLDLKEEHIMRR